MPILEDAGIPSVADFGISFSELTSPMSFPIGATAVGGTGGMGAILADHGSDKVDVPYLDLPGGAGAVAADFVNYGLTARGAPKATQTPVPINGADLTPSVQQTADKDPDGVALTVTDPELSKWVVAYRQSGGEAQLAGPGASVNVDNVETLGDAAEGMLVSNNLKPATLKKDPGVKQMLKEVKAYDSGIKLVDASIGAWAGVHLVADALEGQTTLDAATLVDAAEPGQGLGHEGRAADQLRPAAGRHPGGGRHPGRTQPRVHDRRVLRQGQEREDQADRRQGAQLPAAVGEPQPAGRAFPGLPAARSSRPHPGVHRE